VGVLVCSGRVEEGLRMASALPLAENVVEVIVLAEQLPDGEEMASHLETLEEFEAPVFAAFSDPRVTTLPVPELAAKLPGYDHVISF
jgi:hypothetical protein